jgi:hypothetical protein
MPQGYDYDQATPEVVLTRMSVQDGRLLLPDGMSYRVLVLPQAEQMTPKLLGKLKELVTDGATVVAGAPPRSSPSLADYPQCEDEVKQLARELWGACDGQSIFENRLGKGRLIRGKPLAKVLAEAGAPPDFTQVTRTAGYELRRIHRSIEGRDFYFLANSNAQPVTVECKFRVSGRQPEFWYPDSGRIELAGLWREQEGNTLVTVKLEAAGSVFVVFRRSTAPGVLGVTRVLRNGKADSGADVRITPAGKVELRGDQRGVYELETVAGQRLRGEIKELPAAITLGGPWDLRFPSRSGAPQHITFEQLIPWNEHTNPGVKYFSGTATYSTRLKIPADFLAANRSVFLDLGRLSVIAAVKVNGRDLGTCWKPPFRLEITGAVKAGDNELEVQVVNLWPNRMIGDEQLPPDCRWRDSQGDAGSGLLEWPEWLLQGKPRPTGRFTFSTWKFWKKDSPLVESGLLGPVTLQVVENVTLR